MLTSVPRRREKVGQECVCQLDQRGDVELNFGRDALEIFVHECPVCSESGVVDQRVDGDATVCQLLVQRCTDAGCGQVGGQDCHDDAVGATEFGGECLEAVGPPGDQNQVCAASGKAMSEFHSEPSAGSGDEDGGSGYVDGHGGSFGSGDPKCRH